MDHRRAPSFPFISYLQNKSTRSNWLRYGQSSAVVSGQGAIREPRLDMTDGPCVRVPCDALPGINTTGAKLNELQRRPSVKGSGNYPLHIQVLAPWLSARAHFS